MTLKEKVQELLDEAKQNTRFPDLHFFEVDVIDEEVYVCTNVPEFTTRYQGDKYKFPGCKIGVKIKEENDEFTLDCYATVLDKDYKHPAVGPSGEMNWGEDFEYSGGLLPKKEVIKHIKHILFKSRIGLKVGVRLADSPDLYAHIYYPFKDFEEFKIKE